MDTEDAVSIILSRCSHEYRINSQYFPDKATRKIAFERYMTFATKYVKASKKADEQTPELLKQLDLTYEHWFTHGGKRDICNGKIGVSQMSMALTEPRDILIDVYGEK